MFRQEAGPIGTEGKLDPRIARFAVGATLAALGVISLALPTIDSVASVDLAHPLYSPAPAEQVKPTAIQTVETIRTKAEQTKEPTVTPPSTELKITLLRDIGGSDLLSPEARVSTTTALEGQTEKAIAFCINYPYRIADGSGGDRPLWNIEISREAVPAWESKGAVIAQAKDEQGKVRGIGVWIDVPATKENPQGSGVIQWYPERYPFDASAPNLAAPEWNRQANTIIYKDGQGQILAYVYLRGDRILEGSPAGVDVCIGSKTVTWTDAILTWDPDINKNIKVYRFERTGNFPCVVPIDSPNMCMRADPKDTIVKESEDGFSPRLVDVIPFTTDGCRFVVTKGQKDNTGK